MALSHNHPDALQERVARAIKLARKRYGTMRRFCDDLRAAMGWPTLSAAAVYAWEAGGTRVPAVALVAAAELARVDLSELLRAAAAGEHALTTDRAPQGALAERVVRLEQRVEVLEERLPE